MTVTTEFRDYVSELLAPLGAVTVRNMFGGAGVYCRGVMFGLIADDTLYFKVDESNHARFAAEDAKPFTYEARNGKRVVMNYCEVPARLLDDGTELVEWAQGALEAALRAQPTTGDRRRRAGARRRWGG